MNDRLFSDWGSLTKAVEEAANRILQVDVSPVAQEILKQHIKSDIYDVYMPKPHKWVNRTTYQRRHVLETQVISIMEDRSTILVTSAANASTPVVPGWSFHNDYPGAFLKLLETGNMGIWKAGFPRPAIKNTQIEFDKSEQVESAIKNGIKREIEN